MTTATILSTQKCEAVDGPTLKAVLGAYEIAYFTSNDVLLAK